MQSCEDFPRMVKAREGTLLSMPLNVASHVIHPIGVTFFRARKTR